MKGQDDFRISVKLNAGESCFCFYYNSAEGESCKYS